MASDRSDSLLARSDPLACCIRFLRLGLLANLLIVHGKPGHRCVQPTTAATADGSRLLTRATRRACATGVVAAVPHSMTMSWAFTGRTLDMLGHGLSLCAPRGVEYARGTSPIVDSGVYSTCLAFAHVIILWSYVVVP